MPFDEQGREVEVLLRDAGPPWVEIPPEVEVFRGEGRHNIDIAGRGARWVVYDIPESA